MNITSLKLSALALSLPFIVLSCRSQTYVGSAPPPPPAYSQPPPPPQPAYTEQPAPEQAAPPVSYQSFYDELSPYGQWVNSSQYGYVWIPAAGPAFQPYGSCGHWVLTNYGWTWASDYNWGWAPFHYGNWEYDNMMGWYWIPGYQWAPAWVSWRSCNGYYGWAPLGPSYSNVGYASYYCPPQRYVFVNATYMNNPNMARYYEPQTSNAGYYNRSTVVTSTYYDNGSHNTYYSGPQSTEVERYTGAPIRPVTVVSTTSPEREGGNNNEFRMFRPSVQQPNNANNTNMARPAPAKVYQTAEVTPVQQRQVLTQPNQPRATPFKPENNQRPANQPSEQNRQQTPVEQQRPPMQQQQAPVEQQHQPVQQQAPTQQQHAPVQQQAPIQQQQRPVQQQQHPPVQQQHQPVQQQQKQNNKQQKPANKSQPKQQAPQAQQPQKQ